MDGPKLYPEYLVCPLYYFMHVITITLHVFLASEIDTYCIESYAHHVHRLATYEGTTFEGIKVTVR